MRVGRRIILGSWLLAGAGTALGFAGLGCSDEEPAAEGAAAPAKEGEAAAPAAEGQKPAEAAPAAPVVPVVPSIGKVEAIEGEPVVARGEEKIAAKAGLEIVAGDSLQTPAKSKIRVLLSDGSVVALGAESEAKIPVLTTEKGRKGQMQLSVGKFWMQVSKWAGEGESQWDIETPNAVAGVRGTTLWGDTKVDAICALEGTIEVKSVKNPKLKPATLKAGSCASKLSKGKLAPLKPKPKQVKGFLAEVTIAEAPAK